MNQKSVWLNSLQAFVNFFFLFLCTNLYGYYSEARVEYKKLTKKCLLLSLRVLVNLFLCDVSMAISLKHKLTVKVKQRNVCFDRLRRWFLTWALPPPCGRF